MDALTILRLLEGRAAAGLPIHTHDKVTEAHSTTRFLCKIMWADPNTQNAGRLTELFKYFGRQKWFRERLDKIRQPTAANLARRKICADDFDQIEEVPLAQRTKMVNANAAANNDAVAELRLTWDDGSSTTYSKYTDEQLNSMYERNLTNLNNLKKNLPDIGAKLAEKSELIVKELRKFGFNCFR